MFDEALLGEWLAKYHEEFVEHVWPEERYKWVAVQHFQKHWDTDADNFAAMLASALGQTDNLLVSAGRFPGLMITRFAEENPEAVRAMFTDLFDESRDLVERSEAFKATAGTLLEADGAGSHYQDENVITTYLWLRYPDKYYIYKYGEVRRVARALKSDCHIKRGAYADNLRNHLAFYDEVNSYLLNISKTGDLLRSQLDSDCYEDSELKTLTIDVCFYISRKVMAAEELAKTDGKTEIDVAEDLPAGVDEEQRYWWLNAASSELVMSDSEKSSGNATNGASIQFISKNLRPEMNEIHVGDRIFICRMGVSTQVLGSYRVIETSYESLDIAVCLDPSESLLDSEQLSNAPELLETMSKMQDIALREITALEYENLLQKFFDCESVLEKHLLEPYGKANFLNDVYMSDENYERLKNVLIRKKNIILQGAPGVGKTFAARRLAWSLMGAIDNNRIEFLQFHQSFSYEDFVLGYKPSADGFELTPGIFYRFCKRAAENPEESYFFIVDEINRGNLSKIFGELLMLIERDYRGHEITLAYNRTTFSIPENLFFIGMMNTADRSLALIDYALRRRFSFVDLSPGFDTEGFSAYRKSIGYEVFDDLVSCVKELNEAIRQDDSLGKGFCIGHSYLCGGERMADEKLSEWLLGIVEYEILPMLGEYWFDNEPAFMHWAGRLRGVLQR